MSAARLSCTWRNVAATSSVQERAALSLRLPSALSPPDRTLARHASGVSPLRRLHSPAPGGLSPTASLRLLCCAPAPAHYGPVAVSGVVIPARQISKCQTSVVQAGPLTKDWEGVIV